MTIRRILTAMVVFTAAMGCAAVPVQAENPDYTDLSRAFVTFYDQTEGLSDAERLAAFKRDVAPLFPGFYAPRYGQTQEEWDKNALMEIKEFPKIRYRYLTVEAEFPAAYASARRHFSAFFPDSKAVVTTYLLHSLGEMDGGSREIDGRKLMVFGVDGIARYHTTGDLQAFFDHEMFHIEHEAYFKECDQVWCVLWLEGLATAASDQMNPGATPRALMLETPKPIAAEVDAHWQAALCYVAKRADSVPPDDTGEMFTISERSGPFPSRWGYYVGYRLSQRLLRTYSLQHLAHLGNREAEYLVKGELLKMTDEAGGCAPKNIHTN